MGLDIYCCLIFYGLIIIHLTDPLNQVVQIKCVMCNIYIYINLFTCMYIEIGVHLEKTLFYSLREHCTHTLKWCLFFWLFAESNLVLEFRLFVFLFFYNLL